MKDQIKKYDKFIYEGYDIEYNDDYINITYNFCIENLCKFNPTLKININHKIYEDRNKSFIEYLVFNIGMIELISYWKSTCAKNIIIKCGYLNDEQIDWFKKLIINGLGEFFYKNNIEFTESEINIEVASSKRFEFDYDYKGKGNLIPVGGGKDSNVTLELLKEFDNTAFVINPKEVHLQCIEKSGIKNCIFVERKIDNNLLKLNEEGFLNGHTPFSAIVSFVSLLVCYLLGKENIVLSNESSANESTVLFKNINHQYSKSYDYEKDLEYYIKNHLKVNIKYFSLLRCLNELQITALFSNYKKYHDVFKSCNLGSKTVPWKWCCKCPKCLFTYLMLSAFLDEEELYNIFGSFMLDDEEMLEIYKELLGETKVKPFECVGTVEEVKVASSMAIKRNNKLPLLLKYYNDNYTIVDDSILKAFNYENNIDDSFIKVVKEELDKYVK